MDRKLDRSRCPIDVKGEARGVKQQGGVLDFVTREIEVECLPADIPEHIDVDVSELMMNQGIRVRDVAPDAEVDADQRARHDARARRRDRRSRKRRRPRRGGGGRRRRPSQVIKKGKTDKATKEEGKA